MIKWFAKRYVIGMLNDMLDQYKDDISKVRQTLQVWIARLEKILSCFKSMLAKLDDGKIDSDEIDQTVSEIDTLIKEW